MYKKILLILCTLWSTIVTAASFEATVNTTNVSINQSIKLTLLLTDASAKEQPDLTGLKEYFISRGVQKFQNISSINGKVTNEEGWQIVLQPKMPGELIIPVIPIKTDKGMFYTQAINIYVNAQNTQANMPINIEGKVDKEEMFVQEAFIYTLRIVRESSIANPQLDKLEIADCVVEQVGEQKQKQSIINGKHVESTEIQYLVTPLKEGIITIPPVVLRGEIAIPQAQSGRHIDPFGDIHIFGNFAAVQEYEPFVVQTKAQEIKVKPPIAAINPWLPLYSLEAKESWDNLDNAKVGEPIIRTIILSAVGATGEQLPDLKALHEVDGIKVYAEDPKCRRMVDANINKLTGSRESRFTLIPTKSGTITIPAIVITWWSLSKGETTTTVLPEKTINISAAIANSTQANSNKINESNNVDNIKANMEPATKQIKILYIVIALLIILFFVVIFFMWLYIRKVQKTLVVNNVQEVNKGEMSQQQDNINLVRDIDAMQEFIRKYATKNWQLPENIALKEIPEQLHKQGYVFNQELAVELFKALDKALYGRGVGSLDELKFKWKIFSKEVIITKNKQGKVNNTFGDLNPT